jgi:hypothetical protein
LVVDAIDVVGDDFASDLRIVDEGIVSEVVGADEYGVNGRIHRNVQSLCAIGIHKLAIRKIRRNLITLDIREICVNASKSARRNIITAHSSRNSIVVHLSTRVLGYVLRPGTTTISRVVVCGVLPTDWGSTAIVGAKVTEAGVVGVAVSKGDETGEFLETPRRGLGARRRGRRWWGTRVEGRARRTEMWPC